MSSFCHVWGHGAGNPAAVQMHVVVKNENVLRSDGREI